MNYYLNPVSLASVYALICHDFVALPDVRMSYITHLAQRPSDCTEQTHYHDSVQTDCERAESDRYVINMIDR